VAAAVQVDQWEVAVVQVDQWEVAVVQVDQWEAAAVLVVGEEGREAAGAAVEGMWSPVLWIGIVREPFGIRI
jgi:hypothetical protein